jgi:hypothetical protein
MKVVLVVTGQRYDIVALSEVDHANGTHRLRLIALRIELSTVQLLNELGCGRHPVGPLSMSHCKEEHGNENAQAERKAAAFHHLEISD